jgi:hypothetical protein
MLLNNVMRDMQYQFGEWTCRDVRDRNYSETRVPIVPSAILETLSHQNFGDMRYAQDPNFRFQLARSIYKTLLRYITSAHNKQAVIQPLTPVCFQTAFSGKSGELTISWQGVVDGQEPTSAPTGYVLQIAEGQGDFDNGTLLTSTSCSVKLKPNILYSFRVTAVNDGGQSFPSEVLSALYNPKAKKNVMVVNGFSRLSSPAINKRGQGFDLNSDIGITYGPTAGWLGVQRKFDVKKMGVEDSTGLGYTTPDLQGMIIAGNDFNYARTHAEAISTAGEYNIVSASASAIEQGSHDLRHYQIIDLILGLQKNDGHSLVKYKSFTQSMQECLRDFTACGGNLLVSGAFVGSDMITDEDRSFLNDVLKVRFEGINTEVNNQIQGMGTAFNFHRQLNEKHYAAQQTDILIPAAPNAFSTLVYANNTSAAVAYQGSDYRAFAMGFPLECITSQNMRDMIMRGILKFLSNK